MFPTLGHVALPCPSCGTENPAAARFCMACGTALDATPAATEVRQVTIVFADLVGFTQRSDNADPEDVRRVLVPFHGAAKAAIEAHGGTLDKFIGDAAMGVFGAPVAHEDDPTRAVRAGLALLDQVESLRATIDAEANIRVAVATGDAVVAFGAGPQIGEAVAGDVVNTASRMQSLAPPGGIVVGERTWDAVRAAFDGEAMAPVAVKGKADPIRCWLITGARSAPPEDLPLLGRDDDLRRLGDALARVRDGHAEALTVVAPPGLGKTRLLAEFVRRHAGGPEVLFRIAFQPRGHDSTVGPLADLVADAAGVDRGAGRAAVEAGLGAAVARVGTDEDDRASLGRRLRTVLGAEDTPGPPEGAGDVADALARVMGRGRAGVTVLLVEDLHWADPAARQVLDALPDAFGDAPLFMLAAARPEVLTQPGGALGTVLELSPLPVEATRELLRLVSWRDLDEEAADRIADRAEGNPLFAIEFGRTLGERSGDQAVPTSIRAVVAARLDALPADARAVAIDAAVVGSTFWPGALAALGPDHDVDAAVGELVSRGIVAPLATSRLAGQPAFGFTHALIRDEAYARPTRADRARRHLAAGTWLEAEAGEGAAGFAASLAHHFGTAVDAADTAGAAGIADEARPPAIRWLVAGAEQVYRLDDDAAFTMFERALDLGATGEIGERALQGSGIVGRRLGRLPGPEVLDRYRRALVSARARDDRQAEGLLKVRIGSQLGAMGDSAGSLDSYHEAIAMLEPLPPGRPLAAAYIFLAEEEMFAGRSAESLDLVERGLPIARDLAADADLVIMGLHLRGDARCSIGDLAGGVEDLEEALGIARRSSGAAEVTTSLAYVGDWRWQLEGPAAGAAIFEEGLELSVRAGSANQARWSRTHLTLVSMELGDWDRVLALTDDLLSTDADQLDASLAVLARAHRNTVLLRRIGLGVTEDPEKIVALAEGTHELQSQAPAFGYAAEFAAAQGDREGVLRAIARLDELTADAVSVYRAGEAPLMARLAVAVGEPEVARRFVAPLDVVYTPREQLHADAARAVIEEALGDAAEARRRYRDVADRWRTYRHPWEEAQARLALVRLGAPDADGAGARAATLLAELGIR